MTDAQFRIVGIEKHQGQFLLDIGKLEVRRGEVLGLLGPTGAGKTTLLRLLAGLTRVDRGELYFEKHSIGRQDLPLADRRRLTLVHQRPLLLAGTVRFNVEYGLRLRGGKACAESVDAVLQRLNLTRIAQQPAGTLSGGQIQLVALARALVIGPDVLLLDEPTAHLDPAHVALIEDTILHFRQERCLTVVWATHNLFQARRVAQRTALLLNGRLIEAATTEVFFANPSDVRTSDFVEGRMVY